MILLKTRNGYNLEKLNVNKNNVIKSELFINLDLIPDKFYFMIHVQLTVTFKPQQKAYEG